MVELVNDVSVELINASASDDMVAMAAWVSNDADSAERLQDKKKVRGLINFLYKNKHMSPFEHGIFTFKVDVPLFVAREFHRHRTASYNEVSGRYTEMKPRFYAGDVARVQEGKMGNYYFVDGTNEQTALYQQKKRKGLETRWDDYQDLLESGIAKEQAREDLPLSMMTQFYVTMNPRNLMQFLTLRNDKHALKEIRDVAVKMEAVFAEVMPLTYEAYKAQRDAEIEDVVGLKESNLELQRLVESLESKVSHLKKDVEFYKAERNVALTSIQQLEAELQTLQIKYNKEFVAAEEAKSPKEKFDEVQARVDKMFGKKDEFEELHDIETEHNENPKDDALARGGLINSTADFSTVLSRRGDYLITTPTKIVENTAPVYNVYVQASDTENIAETTRRVIARLDRKRKENRR